MKSNRYVIKIVKICFVMYIFIIIGRYCLLLFYYKRFVKILGFLC